MSTATASTRDVVDGHLAAFVEQRGLEAILADYREDAVFLTDSAAYRGRAEIAGFFAAFLGALPSGAIERFTLDAVRVEGDVAFITWSVGDAIPLGTDTFVVVDGAIAAQTFAMHACARGDA